MIRYFDDEIYDLRTMLHRIIDDLTEEDIRLFFRINEYQQSEGLSYLSLRYRFRQVCDFASWYTIEHFKPEFEPNTNIRLIWKNICVKCGKQNHWTNAYVCPACEAKSSFNINLTVQKAELDLCPLCWHPKQANFYICWDCVDFIFDEKRSGKTNFNFYRLLKEIESIHADLSIPI